MNRAVKVAMGATLVAALLGARGVLAQDEPDLKQAVIVELKFSGENIEIGSRVDQQTFVPKQLGIPRMAPLFFEALGENGEVMYSGEVDDPTLFREDGAVKDSSTEGSQTTLPEASLYIPIPTAPQRPKEFVLYRRTSDALENSRTVVARSGL